MHIKKEQFNDGQTEYNIDYFDQKYNLLLHFCYSVLWKC